MMKKYANKVLAAAMAVSMMVPMAGMNVLAAEQTGNAANNYATSDSTMVKYEVTEEYKWNIHSEIDFGTSDGTKVNTTIDNEDNTVSVTKNVIPDGRTLNISVKGSGENGEFQIKNNNTILSYVINDGTSNIAVDGNVISLTAGTDKASKTLKFTLTTGTGTSEVAGSYTGTVTYTAAVE